MSRYILTFLLLMPLYANQSYGMSPFSSVKSTQTDEKRIWAPLRSIQPGPVQIAMGPRSAFHDEKPNRYITYETKDYHGKNEVGDWIGHSDSQGNRFFVYTSGKYRGKFFGVDKDGKELSEDAVKANFPEYLMKE